MWHNEFDGSSRELLLGAQVEGTSTSGNARPRVTHTQTDVTVSDTVRRKSFFLELFKVNMEFCRLQVCSLSPLGMCVCVLDCEWACVRGW